MILRLYNYFRKIFIAQILNFSGKYSLLRVPVLPIVVDIEPTNLCNLKCSHCPNPYWSRKKKNLNFAQFKHIIKQFPNLRSLKLQGIGEPLLNPDLCTMLDHAEQLGVNNGLTTNGTIFKEKIGVGLQTLKRTKITVSIDAISNILLAKSRTGSDIETIKENIAHLKRANSKIGETLSIWTVVTNDNLNELPSIIYFAISNNIGSITLQMSLNDWSKGEIKEVVAAQKVTDYSRLQGEVDKLRIIASAENIQFNVSFGSYYTKKNKCPWPFMRTYIDVYGNVIPCCNISDAEIANMGNVFEKPFREIWNSKEYVEFRKDIRSHHLREYCKKCYSEPV